MQLIQRLTFAIEITYILLFGPFFVTAGEKCPPVDPMVTGVAPSNQTNSMAVLEQIRDANCRTIEKDLLRVGQEIDCVVDQFLEFVRSNQVDLAYFSGNAVDEKCQQIESELAKREVALLLSEPDNLLASGSEDHQSLLRYEIVILKKAREECRLEQLLQLHFVMEIEPTRIKLRLLQRERARLLLLQHEACVSAALKSRDILTKSPTNEVFYDILGNSEIAGKRCIQPDFSSCVLPSNHQ